MYIKLKYMKITQKKKVFTQVDFEEKILHGKNM